jgi:hypothetical protein
MSFFVDLTEQEEEQFKAYAKRNGTDASTLARKLIVDSMPLEPKEVVVDEENARAIAQLQTWLDEGARATDEERAEAEAELAEFKRNMNANRALTGDHPVYN